MHIKKRFFLFLICITILSFALTACYDLGSGTENDEDYCQTYSTIQVIDGSSDATDYSMEDFYNKQAVNDLVSPMAEEKRDNYTYLIIKVEKSLSIGEIVVYFDSTVEETLSVSFFILDEDDVPTKVYTGEDGKYPEGECDEPDPSDAIGRASCKLKGTAGKWEAIYLKYWTDGETKTKRHDILEGQYIVLRIDNNCYDPAKRKYEKAQKALQELVADYEQKLSAWQAVKDDTSVSQEERDAAMNALTEATSAKTLGERDLEEARQKYEKNKFPYKQVPVRMTAILINAK